MTFVQKLEGSGADYYPYGEEITSELADTLIHELGHVYNQTYGLGGSAVVADANPDGSPNMAKEAQNRKTLKPSTDAISEILKQEP
jgi:hypothetical protein